MWTKIYFYTINGKKTIRMYECVNIYIYECMFVCKVQWRYILNILPLLLMYKVYIYIYM